jgi:hypothetical protein
MASGTLRDAVRIVRGAALLGSARATAFDFAGSGGSKTWVGIVTMQPGACTGPGTSPTSRRACRTRS